MIHRLTSASGSRILVRVPQGGPEDDAVNRLRLALSPASVRFLDTNRIYGMKSIHCIALLLVAGAAQAAKEPLVHASEHSRLWRRSAAAHVDSMTL